MTNILRRHQHFLMVLITFLVIIAFVWLFNGTRYERGGGGSDTVAKIYGRSISHADNERDARRFDVARALQLFTLLEALVGEPQSREQAVENFIWNGRVLRHEADELQIRPTNDQVVAKMKALPAFQTNGSFDPQKYSSFVEEALSPRGFTSTELEDLIRDDLRLEKVHALLDSTVEVSAAEFRTAYDRQFQKVHASVIAFQTDQFANTIEISDDDLKKAYEQRKENLKSDELRRVKYAALVLSDAEKALTGKERIDALQKLANKANDFTQALLGKDAKFDEVAAKFQAPVSAAGPFSQEKPDSKIASIPAIATTAFALTEKEPNSDPVQAENGYYVVHLEEVMASKPLSFDDARIKLTEQLRAERGHETLNLKAAEARGKILEEIKNGKAFAAAAAAAGVQPEPFPVFSLAEPNEEKPNAREVMTRAAELKEGELSEPIATSDGAMLVYLEKRDPVDSAKFEQDSPMLTQNFARGKRALVFQEWLRLRRRDAKVEFLKS
ncbi:MAG: SurA N-terminal domain-containing protein [Verrucomicrobiota bacterium]|nr:SurA N-terminal domain-containing protein [Verrucomicrobiota bacterium]